MLDTITKKRIDDCRDILVGKLPDPKAQIEQITIALIYKFMDDMDKEAIELGGKAKFFSNYKIPNPEFPNDRKKDIVVPFEQYSWNNLFNAKVTATEMLRLYQEAITGMDKNPNIPPLFRDIFKNAFLPYRDPETLKLFLKTIGEFEYTHSEKLGDAFEYLLSVMGSQGDAGQFRTPRHIIDFVVKIVNPGKNESIMDPACGTAGFLISAFKHIKEKSPKGLTPDERKKMMQNFVGYDISPDMVRLSLVNLYLHGFSDPHIWEYDTLSSEERWDETFDVILANPPFMSPKGGIRPHKKFSIASNRSEVLFVDYIAEHLNPKGRAGIIVPEGVIFQSGTAYKELRKMLVENYLYAVVSLPAGVFNPYSGVKTSILLMDKRLAKQQDKILFVKIDNDGYGLGAQRNEVKGGQLDAAVALIHQFVETGHDLSLFNNNNNLSRDNNGLANAVAKNDIAKNGDYNLSGERYRTIDVVNSQYKFFPLNQLCIKITDGSHNPPSGVETGLLMLSSKNIFDNTLNIDNPRYLTTEDFEREDKRTSISPGDVLLTIVGTIGRSLVVKENHPKFTLQRSVAVLKPKREIINPTFLSRVIQSDLFRNILNSKGKGVAQQGIYLRELGSLEIPLPPLPIQEEIVAEIEGYQKIIDGAKAVVDNYKPNIDIDPDWEMVELGKVTQFSQGTQVDVDLQSKEFVEGYDKFLRIENYTQDSDDFRFIPKELGKNKYVTKEDVVVVRYGATAGYIGRGFEGILANNLFKVEPNDFVRKDYLYYYLSSENVQAHFKRITAGGAMPALSFKTVEIIPIAIPSLETQRQIVSQIEKEQALVNANKQLIEIFEQKIKDRIAKVWGSDKKEVKLYEANEMLTMAAEG